MVGLALVAALVAFAMVGPWLVRWDPDASDFSGVAVGASASHWLGTDPLYRDLLARLAYGARLSLGIATLATLLATSVGAVVGMTAGYAARGRLRVVDAALMRLVDVVLAFPFLLLVTAIGVAVGRADVGTILLVLGLTGWPGVARLARAKTIELAESGHATAARALGAGPLAVVRRHVLPNLAPLLVALAASSVAQMILAEAVLGYLTVGVPPPRASWGRMLHEAEPYLATRLSLVLAPGFAILLAVLGFARLGEGLRDALDPATETPAARRVPFDLVLAGLALALTLFVRPIGVRPPLPAAESATEPVRGGVLHLATYVNVRTLDPAVAYDEAATAIEELVFARLVTWSPSGEIVPDLATAIDVSPDGLHYRFELRRGVRFHDGTELRADDVKRSLERALDPRTPSPSATSFRMIAGFSAYRDGKAPHLEGVRVLGDHAIAFDLEESDATFLPVMTLAAASPVCASMGARVDAKSPTAPCGAGPFRVTRFDADAGVRLERHDGYFVPGKPYLDAIEWATNVRPTTQRYEFEDGRIDLVRELSGTDGELYRRDPAWAGRGAWVTKKSINAIFMNTEMPPFDSRAMRRAVAFAVDPAALERVRPDLEENDRVLPAVIPGPDRRERMRRHDEGAALAAMREAGYPFDPTTGRGGYPHPIDYLTLPDTFEQASAEVYQQQLARVGIRIRLRLVSFATYLSEASRRRTTAMGWCGWAADFPDPANFFEPNLSTAAIADEGSQNAAFFSNRALDALLARAHGERDHDARMKLYAEAERIVRDEAPWAPTYVSRAFELWQPYVHGYTPHPILPARVGGAWIDRGARAVARSSARLGLRPASIAFAPFGGARHGAR